jgi:hypothetical protein
VTFHMAGLPNHPLDMKPHEGCFPGSSYWSRMECLECQVGLPKMRKGQTDDPGTWRSINGQLRTHTNRAGWNLAQKQENHRPMPLVLNPVPQG